MTNDLISRSALKADLLSKGVLPAVVSRAIDRAPAITPESLVRHGMWLGFETSAYGGVKDGDVRWLRRKFYRCEKCRKGNIVKSNYCPNCGAKMDLEE